MTDSRRFRTELLEGQDRAQHSTRADGASFTSQCSSFSRDTYPKGVLLGLQAD